MRKVSREETWPPKNRPTFKIRDRFRREHSVQLYNKGDRRKFQGQGDLDLRKEDDISEW